MLLLGKTTDTQDITGEVLEDVYKRQVVDGVKAYMKNEEITTRQLMKYIKGPDFPTGGIVVNKDDLPEIYETGTGKIKIRGKVEVEDMKGGKKRLVITEIPYTMIGAGRCV